MTKEASYTPGPWLIGRGADGYPIIHTEPCSFSPSGQGIAHVCKRPMTQEHVDNARLIAAAPEMFEALVEACDMLCAVRDGTHSATRLDDVITSATAALTKAKGE